MTDYDSYYRYLRQRSRAGLLYRRGWLYPRLSRRLSGKVLDVGCGIGDFVRFRRNTVGVDVNPNTVEFCRGQGLDVHLMQPDRLPFEDGSFDGVVLDNVLEHLPQPAALLAEVHRVLAPDGTFVVGVPGERGYAGDPDHKRHYPQAQLLECLRGCGFAPVEVFHEPFHSRLLDRYFRFYTIYGIFRPDGRNGSRAPSTPSAAPRPGSC